MEKSAYNLSKAIKLLNSAPLDQYNEKLEVLDKTTFNALRKLFPKNNEIKDLWKEYDREQATINNDGFNTVLADEDTPVIVSGPVNDTERIVNQVVAKDNKVTLHQVAIDCTLSRQSEPEPMLTLLSFGGGQDSWAILYSLIYDREFRKKYAPHDLVVVMSDTGNEFSYTYSYITKARALCAAHNIAFEFLTSDMGFHTPGWMNLTDNMRRNKTILGAAMGVKACTSSLKIQPVDKYMHMYMCWLYKFPELNNKRSWEFYKKKYGTKARVIIGFAKDEEARVIKSNKSHHKLPKWKREHIQFVYPMIEEGWNRAKAQEIIKKYRPDVPPPSNCMLCFYQSDQELLWLYRNEPAQFFDWVALEKAKLEKNMHMGKKNYGVFGAITLEEKLKKANEKYGHMTSDELWEYKMSHGHCVKSTY